MTWKHPGSLQRLLEAACSWADGPNSHCQIFDRKIRHGRQERIGGGGVLPDPKLNSQSGLTLQMRLSEQAAKIAGEQIAAAPLGQMRVAGHVHSHFATAADHGSVMALEHDMTIAPTPR